MQKVLTLSRLLAHFHDETHANFQDLYALLPGISYQGRAPSQLLYQDSLFLYHCADLLTKSLGIEKEVHTARTVAMKALIRAPTVPSNAAGLGVRQPGLPVADPTVIPSGPHTPDLSVPPPSLPTPDC